MHKLITLTGRSGCGKSTIEEMLSSNHNLRKAVSHTNRKPRDKEINGETYNFVTKEEMLEMNKNGKFAEFTEYNGNFYGVSIEELNKSDILVIEPSGLAKLRNKIYDNNLPITLISIFIDISSYTAIKRMKDRGDLEENIYSRIEKDNTHFSDTISPLYDFIIDGNKSKIKICDEIMYIYNHTNINKGTNRFTGKRW